MFADAGRGASRDAADELAGPEGVVVGVGPSPGVAVAASVADGLADVMSGASKRGSGCVVVVAAAGFASEGVEPWAVASATPSPPPEMITAVSTRNAMRRPGSSRRCERTTGSPLGSQGVRGERTGLDLARIGPNGQIVSNMSDQAHPRRCRPTTERHVGSRAGSLLLSDMGNIATHRRLPSASYGSVRDADRRGA